MFKLKNKMVVAVILIFGIIAIVRCGKDDALLKKPQRTSCSIEARAAEPGTKITIKAKPYRATKDRPRDHKNCGCKECFGICDVSISVGFEFTEVVIIPDADNGVARIYFTKELSNFDTEFGIDNDIEIPPQALENKGINSLVLKTGIYTFNEVQDDIVVGSENYVTHGYVACMIN